MDGTEASNNNQHRPSNRNFLSFPKPINLILISITLLLTWMAIFQFKSVLIGMGAYGPGTTWSSRFLFIYAARGLFTIALISLLVINGALAKILKLWSRLQKSRIFITLWVVISLIILLSLTYLFYGPLKYLNSAISIRLWFYWGLFWLIWATFAISRKFQQAPVYQKVFVNASLVGFVITQANAFSRINNNPLNASWSEGSVLYYASAFVSNRIYGMQIGLPVINPGRALLQSVPFLIPDLSISAHRMWDAFLWLLLPLLVGYSLVKRLKIKDPIQSLGLLLFSLLFLNLGPIYYHLLIVAFIVLIGFRAEHFWRSLFVVVLASLWAGLTRINWYPLAGSLAAILYWLEVPSQKQLTKDIWKPIVWFVVGFAVAFLSYLGYVQISGTPVEYFENPFSTPLLWYRLFPSATNPTGLLPGILLATLPGLICVGIYFFFSNTYSWSRRIGTFSLLAAFFLGGFLVSVRIGGGNNLHNFDALILILLIMVAYGLSGKIAIDYDHSRSMPQMIKISLIGLLLILPLYKSLSIQPSFAKDIAEEEVKEFHDRVESDTLAGKSVLLIDEPHLIAFDFWGTPPAAPEYEKVFLMEAAMTGNQAYLHNYYAAISSQKYDSIVTEPLSTLIQGNTYSFGEENDAWVKAISEPTLCYYEIDTSFEALGLVYLTPRETVCDLTMQQ